MSTLSASASTRWEVRGGGVDGVRRLGWLSLFGGTCGLVGGIYLMTGRGVQCPFLTVTGWLCPFCGASRMGAALLQGDLLAAWGWNPFVVILGLLLACVWFWTAARVILRRPAGLPGGLAVVDGWSSARITVILMVPAVAFMVLRNIL